MNKLTKAQEKRFDEKFPRELLVEMTQEEIDEYSKQGGSISLEMCHVANDDVKQHLADELARQRKKHYRYAAKLIEKYDK